MDLTFLHCSGDSRVHALRQRPRQVEEQICEEDLGVTPVGFKAPGDSPMQMSSQRSRAQPGA